MAKLRIVLTSAVAGVCVSLLAGFSHADRIVIFGIRIPYGLLLALGICVLTMLWLNRQFQTRLAGTTFAVVWVLVTIRLGVESSNGDLVLSATWYSNVYLIAGAILLSMIAVLPVMALPVTLESADSEHLSETSKPDAT
jgi:uncharacterized membrane protein